VTVALRSHADVVETTLRQAGLSVHRGIGPPDPLGSVPFAVVYAGTAVTDGPTSDPHADVDPEVQVTSVGETSQQAEWLADAVFAALVGVELPAPAGRQWLRPGAPTEHVLTRPVERDVDLGAGAPLFYRISIYALPSTPA
jgi:hypothetical protein